MGVAFVRTSKSAMHVIFVDTLNVSYVCVALEKHEQTFEFFLADWA